MLEHNEKCRYDDKDAILYADLEVENGKRITLAASEISLFDEYYEVGKQDDEGVIIDLDEPDKEPFQIVYGGLFVNSLFGDDKEFALKFVEKFKGYALAEVDADKKVNISGYKDIQLFPEMSYMPEGKYIPFAALMQTKYRLNNMEYSITMFPLNADLTVFENMVNRPFLLACRESRVIDGITKENWENFIDMTLLKQTYAKADLYTGIIEEEI